MVKFDSGYNYVRLGNDSIECRLKTTERYLNCRNFPKESNVGSLKNQHVVSWIAYERNEGLYTSISCPVVWFPHGIPTMTISVCGFESTQ